MSQKINRTQLAIAAGLIGMAVLLRVLPHSANFAPITAIAIFSGAILPRRLAVLTPLTAVVISDLLIGFYNTILVNWACYALIALTAGYVLKKRGFWRGTGLTLASSLFFFLVSNFAVWVWSGMYPRSWSGLNECFTMALPFFRNTALSDLVFTGALFSAYYAVTVMNRKVTPGREIQNT